MQDQLKKIAEVLRREETDFNDLSDSIKDYKSLLHEVTNFDVESQSLRNDVYGETGMALGTLWAALCLDDMIRTKMFVKGLMEAVDDTMKKKEGPVHILYAGTGPFATLILPTLASYSSDQVKCSLMDINTESFDSMKSVIAKFGFEDHVIEFIQADATKVELNNSVDIDILVSETMQRALETEQQVPIVMHLLSQLKKDVILIPEKIDVTACLVDLSRLDKSEKESDYCERLGSVVELSQKQLETKSFIVKENSQIDFEEYEYTLNKESIQKFNQLALMTEIQVYKDNWVRPFQSGLTAPKILTEFPRDTTTDLQYKMQYLVNDDPKIVFSEV